MIIIKYMPVYVSNSKSLWITANSDWSELKKMMRAPKAQAENFWICLLIIFHKFPWLFLNFPDFQQNSKFPWQILKFPDFSLTLNFPDFSLTSGNPAYYHSQTYTMLSMDLIFLNHHQISKTFEINIEVIMITT